MVKVSRDPKQWRVTVLPRPKGKGASRALGWCGGHAVGVTDGPKYRAHCLWWPAGEPTTITVAKHERLQVLGAADDVIAGRWVTAQGKPGGALCLRLVKGALAPVTLHPTRGWAWTSALGAGGGRVVGHGAPAVAKGTKAVDVALCWDLGGKLVELPSVRPDVEAVANATDGAWVGGAVGGNWAPMQAALWPTDGSQLIVLGEPKHRSSIAGVGDGEQVGAWVKGTLPQAAMWRGTAASLVDLTPAHHQTGLANACRGGLQVGTVWPKARARIGDSLESRAALWSGTAASFFDLHAVVPGPWNASAAVGLELRGGVLRIVGEVTQFEGERGAHALAARQLAVWETTLA